MTALTLVDYLMDAYIDNQVDDLEKILKEADIPGYTRSFSAIAITLINLITLKSHPDPNSMVRVVLNVGVRLAMDALKHVSIASYKYFEQDISLNHMMVSFNLLF